MPCKVISPELIVLLWCYLQKIDDLTNLSLKRESSCSCTLHFLTLKPTLFWLAWLGYSEPMGNLLLEVWIRKSNMPRAFVFHTSSLVPSLWVDSLVYFSNDQSDEQSRELGHSLRCLAIVAVLLWCRATKVEIIQDEIVKLHASILGVIGTS